MALDIDDYHFMGFAKTVAMEDFSASFNDDAGNSASLTLLEEYKAAGRPKDERRWLRDRLASIFVCFEERPKWIEATPKWPFINGQAMTFIRQFPVTETPVSSERLAPGTVLYVFGIRLSANGGWQMEYRVVSQDTSLASVGRDEDGRPR